MEFSVRNFDYGSPQYHSSVQLRYRILRVPLGLTFTPEELKKDEHDIHFGLFDGNEIVACLILSPQINGRIKMRQVAVDDKLQGKGLGRQLSLAAEDYARQKGFKTVFCHARKVAAPFYLKLGYSIVGDEFTEVGIPHFEMEKELR